MRGWCCLSLYTQRCLYHSLPVYRGYTVDVAHMFLGNKIMPTALHFKTPMLNHDTLYLPICSFLLESETVHKKVLFDLGLMKGWKGYHPDRESRFSFSPPPGDFTRHWASYVRARFVHSRNPSRSTSRLARRHSSSSSSTSFLVLLRVARRLLRCRRLTRANMSSSSLITIRPYASLVTLSHSHVWKSRVASKVVLGSTITARTRYNFRRSVDV